MLVYNRTFGSDVDKVTLQNALSKKSKITKENNFAITLICICIHRFIRNAILGCIIDNLCIPFAIDNLIMYPAFCRHVAEK